MKVNYKTIEASRELRLWLTTVVAPAGGILVAVLASTGHLDDVLEKVGKVTNCSIKK